MQNVQRTSHISAPVPRGLMWGGLALASWVLVVVAWQLVAALIAFFFG